MAHLVLENAGRLSAAADAVQVEVTVVGEVDHGADRRAFFKGSRVLQLQLALIGDVEVDAHPKRPRVARLAVRRPVLQRNRLPLLADQAPLALVEA